MKKLRGKKRNLRLIEQRLLEATRKSPRTFMNDIYSIKLPASQAFIEALRPKGLKLIANYLCNGATTLSKLKPQSTYKLALLLFPKHMWYSEIIVFKSEQAYHEFFTRQIETGCWREELATLPVTYSHWIGRQFIEDEREQIIICYSER